MDRNSTASTGVKSTIVALRKESVDRNRTPHHRNTRPIPVALRKESVDRNDIRCTTSPRPSMSLSARRAWIEMLCGLIIKISFPVALRKESVDRNVPFDVIRPAIDGRSPQGERG